MFADQKTNVSANSLKNQVIVGYFQQRAASAVNERRFKNFDERKIKNRKMQRKYIQSAVLGVKKTVLTPNNLILNNDEQSLNESHGGRFTNTNKEMLEAMDSYSRFNVNMPNFYSKRNSYQKDKPQFYNFGCRSQVNLNAKNHLMNIHGAEAETSQSDILKTVLPTTGSNKQDYCFSKQTSAVTS